MNPDALLASLLKTAEETTLGTDLADLVLELDAWLSHGGDLPRRWSSARITSALTIAPRAGARIETTIRYRGNLYRRVE
jgi:hypothetical protein